MTLYERVKDALRKGHEPSQIAFIFGVSPETVKKIKDLLEAEKEKRP